MDPPLDPPLSFIVSPGYCVWQQFGTTPSHSALPVQAFLRVIAIQLNAHLQVLDPGRCTVEIRSGVLVD